MGTVQKIENESLQTAALLLGQHQPSPAPAGCTAGSGLDFSVEEPSSDPSPTMQSSVLLRKGAKQTFKNFTVPSDSDIAVNLQKQEQEDRKEKERVKALTLKFNERQEEEDFSAAIASIQRPGLVHTRRDKGYQPPKGAPDADKYFK